MKRLITFSIILFSTFCAYAQDVEKTITLDEVTVKAAKVVNKADGMIRLSGNLVGISINLCKSIQKELFINDTS